jgi:hypothetical protein
MFLFGSYELLCGRLADGFCETLTGQAVPCGEQPVVDCLSCHFYYTHLGARGVHGKRACSAAHRQIAHLSTQATVTDGTQRTHTTATAERGTTDENGERREPKNPFGARHCAAQTTRLSMLDDDLSTFSHSVSDYARSLVIS